MAAKKKRATAVRRMELVDMEGLRWCRGIVAEVKEPRNCVLSGGDGWWGWAHFDSTQRARRNREHRGVTKADGQEFDRTYDEGNSHSNQCLRTGLIQAPHSLACG